MGERGYEAAWSLVLAAGSRLEDVNLPLQTKADARVVAGDEVQERHIDSTAPVAAEKASALGHVERAAHDHAGPDVFGHDPGEAMLKGLHNALKEALCEVHAAPGSVALDGRPVER